MINHRNYPKRPQSLREMSDYGVKMGLNEFVGTDKSDHYHTSNIEKMEDLPLAMAYVPWQQWRMIYESKEAFNRGTIFKELDLPFEAAKECK